jgi:hypothetical protein
MAAEKKNEMTVSKPESQRERWMKYGANVLLTSLVVILLAAMLTWIAQSRGMRIDTTIGGTQSLRPQSIKFIQDLKEPVKIVAVYPRLKSDSSQQQDTYQPVADLLNEYGTKGKNITTEMIDPDTQKDEFNKLVAEVTNKYGGEVKGYKAILEKLPDVSKKVDEFLTQESTRFRALPTTQVSDQDLQQEVSETYLTLVLAHHQLNDLKSQVDSDLHQQIPSYKDGVDDTKTAFSTVSQLLQQFSAAAVQFKTVAALPKAMQDYGPDAAKRADAARKIADDFLGQISKLGSLTELEDFKAQLKSKSIIITTDSGYKILQLDQVWKVPESSRFAQANPDVPPRLSFEGEQQITAAIASLTAKNKPMVVFVRAGGQPLATSMQPEQQPPPFASIAQRLRDDNFDVQEKDLSGQASMQEMPMPEPTEAQMKDAIWVVVRFQHDSPPGEPSPLDPAVEAHIKGGGAAMILLFPTADPMEQVLGPMGIQAKTDDVILHDVLAAPERQTGDFADSALQASQAVMKLSEYGNHPIADPLAGLDFLQAACVPITVGPDIPPGVHATPLLPIPFSPHYWASSNAEALLSQDHPKIAFNPKPDPESGRMTGDADNTPDDRLYGAAAAEGPNGSRLVVVGSYVFAITYLVDLPDTDMKEQHDLQVSRLPGNGEFFVNSILWLAHQDSMLAISPHALQVARIKDMSPATQAFWRGGILTVGLPLAVIAAGLIVYMKRRD